MKYKQYVDRNLPMVYNIIMNQYWITSFMSRNPFVVAKLGYCASRDVARYTEISQ